MTVQLVRLTARHTDADRDYEPGELLLTDPATAKWLSDNGAGERVNESGDPLPKTPARKEKN